MQTAYSRPQQKAASSVAQITNSLDYIIGNAGSVTLFDQFDPIGVLGNKPAEVTKEARDLFDINVIANIHLFNLFTPFLLKGQAKKAIVISSGLADAEFTNQYDIANAPLYSASKAAMNMIIAKFSAQYKQEGVLFLAISPGMVDVGHYKDGMLLSYISFFFFFFCWFQERV